MTRIRLTKKLAAVLNGIDVSAHKVGEILELADSAARMMVAEGWAEPIIDPAALDRAVRQNVARPQLAS